MRRAEYALGKAIRKGQEEGTIRGGSNGGDRKSVAACAADSPYSFAKHAELYGDGRDGGNGVLAMADRAPEPEQFEAALTEARDEGNLSRANVVWKGKPLGQRLAGRRWPSPG